MLYKLGRILQLLGMVILPVGMAGNMTERLTLGEMLLVCAGGIAVFYIGWLLQQSSRPH